MEAMNQLKEMGYHRVASGSPRVYLGNPLKNQQAIEEQWALMEAGGVELAVFPELSLTGYTCGDLFYDAHYKLWH